MTRVKIVLALLLALLLAVPCHAVKPNELIENTAPAGGDWLYVIDAAFSTEIQRSTAEKVHEGALAAKAVYYSGSDLAAKVAEIGATPCILKIDNDATLTADLTIPATMTLEPIRGNVITTGAHTLIGHPGMIAEVDYQVFSGNVTGLVRSNPKMFGAAGNASTNDSTAFTQSIAAIRDSGASDPAAGRKWTVPPGFYKVANIVYDIRDSQIDCQGTLKPISGTTGYTILIGNATSGSGTANIIGNIRVNSGSKGSVAGYSNVEAVRIQNLNQSNITIDQAEGCKTGVMMASDGAGCAYNNIYFGSLMSNNRTVEFSNANGGWVNENKFYGGRFGWVSNYDTGAANDAYCHIYIPYDATHGHNGNIFISPSLEGTFQLVNVDASYNKVLMARTEAARWFANKIQFGSHSRRNEFSNVYSDNLTSNAATHVTAGGGVTITHHDTQNTITIVGSGSDLTPYFYPGSVGIFTVDGSDVQVQILASSYDSGTDTLTIRHTNTGWTSSNTFTVAKSLPVYNAGNYNSIYISRLAKVDSYDFQLQSEHSLLRYLGGALTIRNAMGTDYPLLSLINSSSSGGTVFQTLGSSAIQTSYIKGSGAAWFDSLSWGISTDTNGFDTGGNFWGRTVTVQGTSGGLKRNRAEATATLSGASTNIEVNVPSGAKLLGVQLRVDTAITSATGTTWSAAFTGGSSTALASGQAFTQNTKVSKMLEDEISSGEVDITITPNTGTFTGGAVKAIVYYEELVAMGDAS